MDQENSKEEEKNGEEKTLFMYDLPTNVTRAKIEQVIRNKLAIHLGEYYQMHHLRLQLKYDPIINDTDGYLSRAKVQFASDAVFKLACQGM